MPKILKVQKDHPDPEAIACAAAVLAAGGLVIVPTDTVYGLAADGQNREAVAALFEVKQRAPDKPIAWLASSVDVIKRHGAMWSPAAELIARAFWPGALTMVLPHKNNLENSCKNNWEGYRIPNHPVMTALLEQCGGLLAVTSCNLSGESESLMAPDAVTQIGAGVALALDAGLASGTVPSTVIRLGAQVPECLREGAIPMTEIKAVL